MEFVHEYFRRILTDTDTVCEVRAKILIEKYQNQYYTVCGQCGQSKCECVDEIIQRQRDSLQTLRRA
jgi:hypothetical protein